MNQYKEYAKMFKSQPDLVTVKHMSEMLGVSTKQIYKLIHNGKINAFLCGNTYKAAKVDVIKFIVLQSAQHEG